MDDASLQHVIAQLSSPEILVDGRPIQPGDDKALLEAEAQSIVSPIVRVRQASGAARIVGRGLLARLGYAECAIPKGASGAPVWPTGVVGSFAHDDSMAVAAVGRRRDIAALGIDIEPAEALPADLQELVITPRERAMLSGDPKQERLIFAAKEAIYKAVAARDGPVLEYHDIETDLTAGRATLADGRTVRLRYGVSGRLVVLAFIPQ